MESLPPEILEHHVISQLSPKSRRAFGTTGKRIQKSTKTQTARDKKAIIANILQLIQNYSKSTGNAVGLSVILEPYTGNDQVTHLYQTYWGHHLTQLFTRLPEKERFYILDSLLRNALLTSQGKGEIGAMRGIELHFPNQYQTVVAKLATMGQKYVEWEENLDFIANFLDLLPYAVLYDLYNKMRSPHFEWNPYV